MAIWCHSSIISLLFPDIEHSEPRFVGQVKNITVVVGREVDLDCQVKDVGEYKVRRREGNNA